MFELFFVITLINGDIIKEKFSDSFSSQEMCQIEGWSRAILYSNQVMEKYPNHKGFTIECSRKSWIAKR